MFETLALLTALTVGSPADSITGTWRIGGDIFGNPLSSVCTIQQEGAALSGSCTDAEGRPQEITGRVEDGRITFQHGGDYEGEPLTVVYSGTLASPTELRGRVEVQPFDVDGVFTATRVPADP
jgi:hypothetical protein